jgi:hypothetical protein
MTLRPAPNRRSVSQVQLSQKGTQDKTSLGRFSVTISRVSDEHTANVTHPGLWRLWHSGNLASGLKHSLVTARDVRATGRRGSASIQSGYDALATEGVKKDWQSDDADLAQSFVVGVGGDRATQRSTTEHGASLQRGLCVGALCSDLGQSP